MNVYELGFNIVESILVTQFFVRHFGVKDGIFHKAAKWILPLYYFIVLTMCNSFGYIQNFQAFLLEFLWLLAVIVVLKGDCLEKLLMTLMSSVIMSTTAIFLFIVFGKWITYDSRGYPVFGIPRALLCIFAKVIYFVATEFIIRHPVKEKQYVKWQVYIKLNAVMLATMAAYTFLTDIIYVSQLNRWIQWEALSIVLALFAVDIIIYILFVELSNNSVRLMKEQMKNAAYRSEIKNIEAVQEIYQKTISVRHDMKNVLLLLRMKIREGKIEEADKYLENVLNIKLAKVNRIITDSAIMDAVLNRYLENAQEQGIDMAVLITCSLKQIDEMDLAVVLANLLENALEAAAETEKPMVRLNIRQKEGFVSIEVSNSYCSEPQKKGDRLITSKKDKLYHGYGLANVQQIVDTYRGFYEYWIQDSIFITNILLYIS